MIQPQKIPTLKQVAATLVKLCNKNSDVFTPTMLRRLLGEDFPHTEPASLSSQIQPHLRALKQAKVVEIISTNQKRNRPYRVINRDMLIEISKDEGCILQIFSSVNLDQDDDEDVDGPGGLSKDESINQINELEQRLIYLEESMAALLGKLKEISDILKFIQIQ